MALLTLLGFSLSSAATAPGAPSPKSFAGCYLKPVQARHHGAHGRLVKTYSYLEIKGDAGSLEFEAVIIGGSLNICGADGKLAEVSRSPAKTVLRRVQTLEELEHQHRSDLRPCRLQIVATSDAISLQDPGGACRKLFFCGAGVGLDGERFDTRRTTQTKGKRCPPY